MPPKIAESQPWEHSCVDMIGPCQIQRKGKKTSRLQAITVIDPAAGWFEIIQLWSRMKQKWHDFQDAHGHQESHTIMALNSWEVNSNI
jgi:hypothetical protein